MYFSKDRNDAYKQVGTKVNVFIPGRIWVSPSCGMYQMPAFIKATIPRQTAIVAILHSARLNMICGTNPEAVTSVWGMTPLRRQAGLMSPCCLLLTFVFKRTRKKCQAFRTKYFFDIPYTKISNMTYIY